MTHLSIAVGVAWVGPRLRRRIFRLRPAPLSSADLRFAALGGVLPDLIDQPLHLLLPGPVGDSHAVGHTLLLSLLLAAAGSLLALRGDARALLVATGSLSHILVDPVVAHPHTLFWPLFGTGFPEAKGIAGAYLLMLDIALIIALASWLYLTRRTRPLVDFLRAGRL